MAQETTVASEHQEKQFPHLWHNIHLMPKDIRVIQYPCFMPTPTICYDY